MANTIHYYRTAKRPDLKFWLEDDDGALIDFSAGYTFSFKLGQFGVTATFTKTAGITGAAGSGTESSGTPNVTISFTGVELDSLSPGYTNWQITATTAGLPRFFQGTFQLHDVIL